MLKYHICAERIFKIKAKYFIYFFTHVIILYLYSIYLSVVNVCCSFYKTILTVTAAESDWSYPFCSTMLSISIIQGSNSQSWTPAAFSPPSVSLGFWFSVMRHVNVHLNHSNYLSWEPIPDPTHKRKTIANQEGGHSGDELKHHRTGMGWIMWKGLGVQRQVVNKN